MKDVAAHVLGDHIGRFDHEYRSRLTAFMQQQMRALWASQPQVQAEFEQGEAVPGELMPAPRTHQPESQT